MPAPAKKNKENSILDIIALWKKYGKTKTRKQWFIKYIALFKYNYNKVIKNRNLDRNMSWMSFIIAWALFLNKNQRVSHDHSNFQIIKPCDWRFSTFKLRLNILVILLSLISTIFLKQFLWMFHLFLPISFFF